MSSRAARAASISFTTRERDAVFSIIGPAFPRADAGTAPILGEASFVNSPYFLPLTELSTTSAPSTLTEFDRARAPPTLKPEFGASPIEGAGPRPAFPVFV